MSVARVSLCSHKPLSPHTFLINLNASISIFLHLRCRHGSPAPSREAKKRGVFRSVTGERADNKVLNVGEELLEETLPLKMGSRLYELRGLKSSAWYEVKISYPASIPSSFTIQLKKDKVDAGVNLKRKDMTQDSTFEFERKRNRPERYDRNVAENTLKVIKKIDKIRVTREERHHKIRMKGKASKEKREAVKELEQHNHMIKAPTALLQEHSLPQPKIKVKAPRQQTEENRAMEE